MQIFSLHWMMQNISVLVSPRSPSGSLHWMMQNISVLMSPRGPSGFTDIKKPNVLHHPVQAKNLHFNP